MSFMHSPSMSNRNDLSDQEKFIQSIDWAATDVGPPSTWPDQLTQALDFVLADPNPAALMWGERLTMIYNKGFNEFAGTKHPRLMGSTPIIEYAEVWSMFIDIIDRGRNHGSATRHENVRLFLNRNGFLEECFVTYTFIPLKGQDSSVVGFYHTALDTTREVRSARRTRTLLAFADVLALSRSVEEYWANLIQGLEDDNEDLWWTLAYSISGKDPNSDTDDASSTSSTYVPRGCAVMGRTKNIHGGTLPEIHIDDQDDLLTQKIQTAMQTNELVVLSKSDGGSIAQFFEASSDLEDNETCNTAVLAPIRPISKSSKKSSDDFGFLILGLAAGVAFDYDCAQFIKLFGRQAGASAANAIFFDEKALYQQYILQQLSTSSQRAKASEERLSRFFEVTNIGMWMASPKSELVFANKAWYRQARLDPDVQGMCVEKWVSRVADESMEHFQTQWATLTTKFEPVTFECQFKTLWESRDPATGELMQGFQWFLISALPEFHADGRIKMFWGCNVDVSSQKWYQAQINNRLQETLEAKRQTENFIDMVSHEIRNPLSAITQSADSIASIIAGATRTLSSLSKQTDLQLQDSDIESISESASIILTCASHQKTIVDDILTLSKLDASLLTVNLEEVDPIEVVHDALKLHQQQFETADVQGTTEIDIAYQDLNVDRVLLDRNRVFQVLINLLTNAIKFTKPQPTRNVKLHLSASSQRPSGSDHGVNWLDSRQQSKVGIELDEDTYSLRDEVFIHFAVEDSGCGMTPEEMQHLFTRFSQASPKTQVRYGGSGLGLFICKEIVELQGGRIGLTSTPGKGSIFRFFLKVQRSMSTEQAIQQSREQLGRTLTNGADTDRIGGGFDDLSAAQLNISSSPMSPMSPPEEPQASAEVNIPAPPAAVVEPEAIMSVLVVEDNMINQKLLANQLRRAGCVVNCANHGAEALAFLERTIFAKDPPSDALPLSIVLMDIEMPVMDGLTCVSTIRRYQEEGQLTGQVPVIAVTANARPEHVQKAKDHGMDDVIIKPFHLKDLLARMRALLAERS